MDLEGARLLVAEDDLVSARIIEFALAKRGADVVVVHDGRRAIEELGRNRFEALVTDWMMPEADGLEVIKFTRAKVRPVPAIVMITVLDDPQARAMALSAGADEFLARPCAPTEVVRRVELALARSKQPAPVRTHGISLTPAPIGATAPFIAIGIASGTGGPDALRGFLRTYAPSPEVAIFVTQHGPEWMMESLVTRLTRDAPGLRVVQAEAGTAVKGGHLYLAHGEAHLVVDGSYRLQSDKGPPENFVRPAADPMLRSLAARFGRQSVGVVLTGLGRDGALGAAEIVRAGGVVYVQDPDSAMAPAMPQTAVDLGMAKGIAGPEELGQLVCTAGQGLATALTASGVRAFASGRDRR